MKRMLPLLAFASIVTLSGEPGRFVAPAAAQSPAGGVVALTGARLIDGTGGAPIVPAAIVMSNGRIDAAGPVSAVTIPAGAQRIDVSGKTIIPGIINAHGHLNAVPSGGPARDRLRRQLRVYADYGITTVVVLGTDDIEAALELRDEQESSPVDRARVYAAGPSLRDIKTAEEVRRHVDRYADLKADIVKFHIMGGPNDMMPAVYGALIDEAHKRGLRAAAHLFYLKDAQGLVAAGVDVIAHSVRDQNVDAPLIAAIKQRNVAYIPTLTRDLAQFVYETPPAFFDDAFFKRHLDAYRSQMTELLDPARQEKTRASKDAQATKTALEQGSRNLKILSDAGVTIALGTDSGANVGQWQGYFEHTELEMMVKAGMTPMQALVAATSGAARAMKLDAKAGTLQPGKVADLVVLTADPLADIRNTRTLDSVWIAGRRLTGLP
jgi:imidazolonepropionase-like amidohydrolase